ncbi:MAG: hypothetical protein JWN70_4160 [Planctomycetaceae bacterium]|nr:hypothetical protein [Planctomycetaceae bacterium]
MYLGRLTVLLLLFGPTWLPAADQSNEKFFQSEVEPLLVRRCLECHAAEARGGLDLRTRGSMLKGGETGAVIVPGKPAESLLYEHVSTEYMPPKKPLKATEIAVFKTWIERGAFFPERALDLYTFGTDRRGGYDWWSLQAVARPAVPDFQSSGRQRTPIDGFILARLQEAGLSFSDPADRATYIRRATYDLHGLPPTYAEVQAFIHDTRPDAYALLIDRLLASPRYGERWGRHWLDIVRFAESNGFERDRLRTNFWRYRDYVISAFNADLPYNDFVREQLAGDALRPNDPQALIATGFLVAGPKNDVGTISELERMMTRQDELDEYVVATGTTFLGLTIGCARCHDHKFDPIPTRDYYSFTSIFSGLDRNDNVVAQSEDKARYAAASQVVQKRIDAAKSEIAKLLNPVRETLVAQLTAERAKTPQTDKLPPVNFARNEESFTPVVARFLRFEIKATTGAQPCLDELEVYGASPKLNLALASAGAKASASSLLPGYPIHQIQHLNDGKPGNSASWISNEPGKGWAQIEFPRPVEVSRIVWGRDREGSFQDRLATDYSVAVSGDGQAWTMVSSSERRLPFQGGTNPAPEVSTEQILARLTAEQRSTYDRLLKDLGAAEAELKAIPPLPVSYSASDGATQPAFILRRGNVRDRQDPVDPRALSAVTALDPNLLRKDQDSGPQRRLRLAEWIVDPRNPLTARVIVNRVWQYHFGQGIVETPSDLGFNGDRPSHAHLLDWLATDFMDQGWKLKRLHKLIMLSDVYRQSSQSRPAAAAKDGTNRLLWRMNPQRVDAEALRDSVLQTSGQLNLQMGGPSYRMFNYRDGNVPDYLLLEKPGPETWRRGVYMFNIRTFQEPLMSVFDCPDPSVQTPRRGQSTTALQALSLMNNPFVFDQSKALAERATKLAGPQSTPQQQVQRIYELVYARDPAPAETAAAVDFIKQTDLFSLCRVLLNSNEFLYVQ